jgi:hypothetical protein
MIAPSNHELNEHLATKTVLVDLFTAERALGRLDQMVDDQAIRARATADACRRDAIASTKLDGLLVHQQDFIVAIAGMGFAPQSGGMALTHANATWQLAETLGRQSSIAAVTLDPIKSKSPAMVGTSSIVDDAWKALAEVEALLASNPSDVFEANDQAPPDSAKDCSQLTRATPWTSDWIAEHFLYWQSLVSGRSIENLRHSKLELAPIQAVLADIDQILEQSPGLLGMCRALYLLHQCEDLMIQTLGTQAVDHRELEIRRIVQERGSPSWIWMFARLVAPMLIQRNCHVQGAWVPFSFIASTDLMGYRMAASGSEAGWVRWIARKMRDAIEAEIRRVDELSRLETDWQDRVGPRRKNSSIPDVISLIFHRPAFTVRQVEHRLGLTFRGAQLIVSDLDRAGIVRDVTSRALDRVFVARDLYT